MEQGSLISIHAPRMGCDAVSTKASSASITFQSTHPVWGATLFGYAVIVCERISIHAPRMGCDPFQTVSKIPLQHFNPRTPYGVRLALLCLMWWGRNFNPRTPYGVRLIVNIYRAKIDLISIHAPRMGCDLHELYFVIFLQGFQSTHPVWGATEIQIQFDDSIIISIHAPRMGCDLPFQHFRVAHSIFQSTHPVWGATAKQDGTRGIVLISIHAPRMGCDAYPPNSSLIVSIFQSTHPVWGATAVLSKKINDFQISALYFLLRPPKTAFSTRKPPFKPHIRRTLAKRHAQ